MTFDELKTLLNERRSIRYFSDTPLKKADIEKILAAATLAPSVENLQPWHFHVVTEKDLKTKLMETSCYGNFVAGAAAFIVVTCNRKVETKTPNIIWNPRELEYSCINAMQLAMLAATTMNIGSCWISLHHGPVHNLLKLPDHHTVVGGLMLGTIKESDKGASREHQRRDVKDAITYYA